MIVRHLYLAWTVILLGFLTGSVHGLFFHREDWWGGYGSWSRRVARLGHVSLFGLALINLGFAFTVEALELQGQASGPSALLIAGTFTMPLACYLSSWKRELRHLFVFPVLSLLFAAGLFLIQIARSRKGLP